MTQKEKFILSHDSENHIILRILIALPKIRTKIIKKSRERNLEKMIWKLILKLPEDL